MGKTTGSRGGYGHHWRYIGFGSYRLFWSFDTKVAGSRLRFPRTLSRDTDFAGAVRFAKKWNIKEPE